MYNELLKKDINITNPINNVKEVVEIWLLNSKFCDKTLYPSGCFMSTILSELYLIYFNSFNVEEINKKIENSDFKEEIEIFKKICFIIGMEPIDFLVETNGKTKCRTDLQTRFLYLTKEHEYWNNFENILDLLIVNKSNDEQREFYLNKAINVLKRSIDYLSIGGLIDSEVYFKELNSIFLSQVFVKSKRSK